MKTPQSALLKNDESFYQILNAVGDLVFVKSESSKLVWANKAFCEYKGWSEAELRGVIDAPLNEEDKKILYADDDARVFCTGEVIDIPQEPIHRHDGVIRQFHTVKSPIFDENGKVVMIVGISRDITDTLEKQKQLEQERARAMHSSKMGLLGQMAGGVAHEN